MNLNDRLRVRHESGELIRVGIVGAGQMGTGMIAQIAGLRGMTVTAVADIDLARAERSLELAGIPANQALATADALTLAGLPEVDIVVECTGLSEVGAEVGLAAIEARKHLVMMNVEADVTVGPLLNRMAKEKGLIYSGSAGDEPASTKELYNFADMLGWEILVAGKGKNNPLRQSATPDDLMAEANAKQMNVKMLTSFVDGTKTMVEMTCLANATGMTIDRPGMHGVTAQTSEVVRLLRTKEEGGVLDRYGVVEFVNGIAPGVFVIFRTEQEVVAETLRYVRLGDGPNFMLYRPYHLTSLETPVTIAQMICYGEAAIAPLAGPVAESVAVTKRALKPGEMLDGIGGYTVYGHITTHAEARREGYLPVGLAFKGVKVRRPVAAGATLTYDDVDLPGRTIVELRRQQDRIFA